jgi:hypothetical protein
LKKYSREDQAALAEWALDTAERVLPLFERSSPDDLRPREAIRTGRDWVATRDFRMPVIRKASLEAHAAAKDVGEAAAAAAAHAAGQAVATAHVPQHAYGGAYYALKAIIADRPDVAERLVAEELARLRDGLPEHLRDEVMNRVVVEHRPKGLFVSITKGMGF